MEKKMPTGKTGSRQFKMFTCEYCQGQFTRYICATNLKDKQFRFCSPICRNKSRKVLQNAICIGCGQTFMPIRASAKYHSHTCWLKHGTKNLPKREGIRTVFTTSAREQIKLRFANEGPERLAEELHTSIGSVQTMAYSLGVKLGSSKKKLCFEPVHDYMQKHNPMRNQQSILKMKNTRDERHPNHMQMLNLLGVQAQNKHKPTKPEQLLQSILTDLRIEYEAGVIIKPNFVVDVKIGQLIIQVDGEYWHGHPRFEPLTERQLKQRQRDAAQDRYLHACGYKVVRLWESQISKDAVYEVLKENFILP